MFILDLQTSITLVDRTCVNNGIKLFRMLGYFGGYFVIIPIMPGNAIPVSKHAHFSVLFYVTLNICRNLKEKNINKNNTVKVAKYKKSVLLFICMYMYI